MTDGLRERVNAAVGSLYHVEAEIGRGGMAVVYRALDTRLKRKVALKVLPPELAYREEVRRRFLREAQMAAQLSHPNIVPIYSVDESAGVVYFAMGLVEGDPLSRVLHLEPRPALAMVRRILREVADALHYAHSQGVVHRDIKPDNILIDQKSGRALVTDFGIARAAEGDARMTATGIAVGTPAYMSPEQAMGEREIDGRADIYALGIVGYQMLAGELPFQAANTPSMLMKHLSERPRPLLDVRPDLPANLASAIERALAKGPDERWPDAAAFRDALADSAPVTLTAAPAAARVSSPPHPPSVGAVLPPSRGGHDAPAEPGDWVPKPLHVRAGMNPLLALGVHHGGSTRPDDSDDIRTWREQRRLYRQQVKQAARDLRNGDPVAAAAAMQGIAPPRALSDDQKVMRVRRKAVNYLATTALLFGVNLMTRGAPWFLIPAFFMGAGLLRSIGGLWADHIPLSRLFTRPPRDDAAGSSLAVGASGAGLRALPAPGADPLLAAVPRDVLDGAHGQVVRDAVAARRIIADVLLRLPEGDKQLLPDIEPSVRGLVERVISLAGALTQLDADASPAALARLDQRLVDANALAADAPDRDRRVTLLERQRQTLRDLAARREAVAAQLDNASLVLETMKLDLLKLRSSGFQSQMADANFQTQDARAVVKEIERALEVAEEVQKIR